MKTITLQDIKRSGYKSFSGQGTMYVIVNSRPKAVLVPIDEYESLIEALEDQEDKKEIEARKHEDVIPFDKAFS